MEQGDDVLDERLVVVEVEVGQLLGQLKGDLLFPVIVHLCSPCYRRPGVGLLGRPREREWQLVTRSASG